MAYADTGSSLLGTTSKPVAPIKTQQEYNQVAAGPGPAPLPPLPPPDKTFLGGSVIGSGALGGQDFRDLITNTPLHPGSPGLPGVGTSPPPASPDSAAVALAKAMENQGIGSLDAWLKAQREQAIIASGDPALAGQAGFGLDPQAGVFAKQNYLSGNADLARVARAKDLAHQAIINRLAAHGILGSGELGFQEGQSNIDFGNQEYDVRKAVLAKLADLMQQYLDRKSALKQATVNAMMQDYETRAKDPPTNYLTGGGGGDASGGSYPSDNRMSAIVNLLRSR